MKGKSAESSREVYISVDIEAAGPFPPKYSMLSLGACEVDNSENSFYVEMKPINRSFIKKAISVGGFSIESLMRSGTDPSEAMKLFKKWIIKTSGNNVPVFVGFNAPFDWQYVNWYFFEFIGSNPFGINALDIKAYYMGISGTNWLNTSSSKLPEWLRRKDKIKHHALSDAVAQGEIFHKLLLRNSEIHEHEIRR